MIQRLSHVVFDTYLMRVLLRDKYGTRSVGMSTDGSACTRSMCGVAHDATKNRDIAHLHFIVRRIAE